MSFDVVNSDSGPGNARLGNGGAGPSDLRSAAGGWGARERATDRPTGPFLFSAFALCDRACEVGRAGLRCPKKVRKKRNAVDSFE